MSDRDFRLSKDVKPVRYELRIEADLDNWRFLATESVEITIAKPTNEVILHAIDLEILSVTAMAGAKEQRATVSFNEEAETAALRFPQALPTGSSRLQIDFRGAILDRLRGFYRSQKDGARYAATQFEAADARRAFPCFDEPEFKARFALTLVVPTGAAAIANGAEIDRRELDDGRTEIRFAETPPISSYLVAYCIGPFEPTPVVSTPTGVPVRVFLPRGMAEKGAYARDAHLRSLTYLEEYTGIPYPYGKVDAIGVPDFEAGAMENPGAITYRLTAIAADPERASTPALKGIFYTAAHELTHMWWGDLVTMAWWDDLWLNESFATFVGSKAVAELVPEWGTWRDFVATLSRPFALDSLVSTHPISFEVRNAKQATERFDVITYWKGAGVVRMIEGFLGADAFRAGVRTYLDRYREGNATADDFWHELAAASGRDVGKIANAWIKEPGHPLVQTTAARQDADLRVSLEQQRFFADPKAARQTAAQHWPIPLVLKYGHGDGVHEERVLLGEERMAVTLPKADWYFPNGGASGFYRFAMDDASLQALVSVLQAALEPHERLLLAGNQWALLKAGAVTAEQFVALLEGYRTEPDRAVVSTIAEQLGWLGTHVASDSSDEAFQRFVDGFYRPQLDALGWDARPEEAVDERIKRGTVIGALGAIARSQHVREEARKRIDKYLDASAGLDPNIVSAVAGIAAIDGDDALYGRYLAHRRNAARDPEEEQRFLLALAAFERQDLINRTLEMAVGTEVRAQDRTFLLAGLLGRRESRMTAWEFVRDRWNDLTELIDPMLRQGLIRSLAQLTAAPVASEVCEFLEPRATPETRETIAQVVEQLRIDAATVTRLQPGLGRSLGKHG
jgi:puromycin-sensitive aminopeptidase